MHDKTNERYEAMVQRVFGPSAALAGSMGTADQPGDVQIILDGRVLGRGGTFQEALNNARAAAGRQERPFVSEPASQTA